MSVDVGEDVGEFTDDGFGIQWTGGRKQVPDRGEDNPLVTSHRMRSTLAR